MSNVRVRFAPSPTGFLHIGSLRTVLFTYLIARHERGKFILRIEDTDQKREVEGAVDGLLDILSWAGLSFDEGPGIGGDYGPYTQSERILIYDKYKDELLKKGGAYPCFCTPERLEAMRADQQAKKMPPRYDRCCRELSSEEAQRRIKSGEPFVIRQKTPLDGEIVVHDELRGDIRFMAQDLDDQVLIKSNGVPTYQFASVVDDHLMEISHVTRADEWLSSFPKNILLYEAFGWTPPKFIHYSVILNKEGGGKLSKRQGDVAVEDFRAKGYLADALINFCSLLGWHPKGDNEILSLSNLESMFDYKDISASPAVFDMEKLDYFNGYYIRQMQLDDLVEKCTPYLIRDGLIKKAGDSLVSTTTGEELSEEFISGIVSLEQERMKRFSDIPSLTHFFFVDYPDYSSDLLVWKKMALDDAKMNITGLVAVLGEIAEPDWSHENIENVVMSFISTKGLKVGEVLWPMRVALTGEKASPGPFEVAAVLGKNKSLARLQKVR